MSIKPDVYDVVIVGAGIAGCALAHGLATITSKSRARPLKIALLERSFAEPDRIVGELLQPGGVNALKKLGMLDCVDDIGAVPVHGYCVLHDGKEVHIPYPDNQEGRSFHHGRFIQALRDKARKAPGVDAIEASVTELIYSKSSPNRVVGVCATRRGEEQKEILRANLTFVADGCFSAFRSEVMGEAFEKPITRSYFVGAILHDAELPLGQHAMVALSEVSGPVLAYQIEEHDTRILIDIKAPLPSDLKTHILENVLPGLPESLHVPLHRAVDKGRIRRMPNTSLPPIEQGGHQSKSGVVLVGDAWNMRHPITGGGMTVALNDVVILTDLLRSVRYLDDWDFVSAILHSWHWSRKPLGSTINILSIALCDLVGGQSIYDSLYYIVGND